MATIRDALLSGAHPVSGGGGPEATAVPVQASVADPRYDDHRIVCHGVRLGPVSADQGAIKLHLQLDHQGCLPC